jgi:hypothetical protein
MKEMQARIEHGRSNKDKKSKASSSTPSTPLTTKDKLRIKSIRRFATTRMDSNREAQWVLRRFGYTKEENPNNGAGLLALPLGQLVGQLSFPNAETYTVTQALKCVADAMKHVSKCPKRLMFDETTVINTLQRELQDVLDIVYYAPPSAEEKELAQHAGSLPGFQGLKMMP